MIKNWLGYSRSFIQVFVCNNKYLLLFTHLKVLVLDLILNLKCKIDYLNCLVAFWVILCGFLHKLFSKETLSKMINSRFLTGYRTFITEGIIGTLLEYQNNNLCKGSVLCVSVWLFTSSQEREHSRVARV